MTQSGGEVFDLGYQHYDGPREGRVRAFKALWVNGVRTALGLGRGSRAQVLPILLFVSVMAPAVILALVASQGAAGSRPACRFQHPAGWPKGKALHCNRSPLRVRLPPRSFEVGSWTDHR